MMKFLVTSSGSMVSVDSMARGHCSPTAYFSQLSARIARSLYARIVYMYASYMYALYMYIVLFCHTSKPIFDTPKTFRRMACGCDVCCVP